MSAFRKSLFTGCCLVLFAAAPQVRAATNAVPDFSVVLDLVRAHLAGTSAAEVNRAAVEGLLDGLRGKVRLVSDANSPAVPPAAPLVGKTNLLEGDIAYLRVTRVADGLAVGVKAAYQGLSASNKLKGLVLDLRFADGENFAAAAAVADLFVAKERGLLDWGRGAVKSTEKPDALTLPVGVLINRETMGAAEAVAAILREVGAALLLGGTTAGAGMVMTDYPLPDGQSLRIASAPVKLGDGTILATSGVKPDIEVKVALEEERIFIRDAYGSATKSAAKTGASTAGVGGTNAANRRLRITEADLVRERREGKSLEEFTPARDRELPKPPITDPALARAVDLLKGLAVVRRTPS